MSISCFVLMCPGLVGFVAWLILDLLYLPTAGLAMTNWISHLVCCLFVIMALVHVDVRHFLMVAWMNECVVDGFVADL